MKLHPETTAFVFPGQGSQLVGMGHDLAKQYPAAKGVFEHADSILDLGLSTIMWEGPEATLNDTVNTQPALLIHSVAAFQVFREIYPEFRPAALAGHSLGELSALVAGGALPFEAALRLVRTRGELMKRAGERRPGGMAAILNVDIAALEEICDSASVPPDVVQVANDNCPGQVVISGAAPAVERAMQLAKEAGARRAIPLAVSIAAHSKLMATIQDEWNEAVGNAGLGDTAIPLIGNVTAESLRTGAQLSQDLQLQMQSRVRWTETITRAVGNGITDFVELGTGSVLLGLIRRIASSAAGWPLGTPADFAALA
jgi:[acyl-carrier-protein] S-malonyltransferase